MAEPAADTQGTVAGGGTPAQGGQPASGGTPAQAAGAEAQSGGGGGAAPAPTTGTPGPPAGGDVQARIQALERELAGRTKQVSDREKEISDGRAFRKAIQGYLGDDPLAVLEASGQETEAPQGAPAQGQRPATAQPDTGSMLNWPGWLEDTFNSLQQTRGLSTAIQFLTRDGVPTLKGRGIAIPEWASTLMREQAPPAQQARPQGQQVPAGKPRLTPVQQFLAQKQFVADVQQLGTEYGADWLNEQIDVNLQDLVGPEEAAVTAKLTRAQALELYCTQHGVSAAEGANDLWAGALLQRAKDIGFQRGMAQARQANTASLGPARIAPAPSTPAEEQQIRALEKAGFGAGIVAVRRPDHAAEIEFPDGVSEGGR